MTWKKRAEGRISTKEDGGVVIPVGKTDSVGIHETFLADKEGNITKYHTTFEGERKKKYHFL